MSSFFIFDYVMYTYTFTYTKNIKSKYDLKTGGDYRGVTENPLHVEQKTGENSKPV